MVGPHVPVDDTPPKSPWDDVKYCVVYRNDHYFLAMQGLQNHEDAFLPIDLKKNCKSETTTIVIKIADSTNVEGKIITATKEMFAATKQQYLQTGVINEHAVNIITRYFENPSAVLHNIIIKRMRIIAWLFLCCKPEMAKTADNSTAWEKKLYLTLRRVGLLCDEWVNAFKDDAKCPPIYVQRASPSEFSLVVSNPQRRIYLNQSDVIGRGSCKVVKACIEIFSRFHLARLKPLKDKYLREVDKPTRDASWNNEVIVYNLLLRAVKLNVDLEGLLFPRDIINYSKIVVVEGEQRAIKKTQIYVDRLNIDLREYINAGRIKPEDKLKMCYQVTKGLNTLLTVLGYTHRDIKPDNILVDDEGNLYIMDFGFARPRGQISKDFLGTRAYLPPEAVEATLVKSGVVQKPKKDIYSEPWDAWSLGVVLYMILKAGTARPVPPFFTYLHNKRFDLYFTTVNLTCTQLKADTSSLEKIIDSLLIIDPVQRLTVPQAFAALDRLYNKI